MSKDFDVIAHCLTVFCTMGAGIAPQIKSKFPDAYIVDCQTIRGDINKLGTISYTIHHQLLLTYMVNLIIVVEPVVKLI
jgi:O-acetyl-ADP-ribose deacetylase (regulator of RNase III)